MNFDEMLNELNVRPVTPLLCMTTGCGRHATTACSMVCMNPPGEMVYCDEHEKCYRGRANVAVIRKPIVTLQFKKSRCVLSP